MYATLSADCEAHVFMSPRDYSPVYLVILGFLGEGLGKVSF